MRLAAKGFSSGQISGMETSGGIFPKSCRTTVTTAETGFHSAIVRMSGGMPSVGTKAVETNASGSRNSSETLESTSGDRTLSPT